MGRQYAHPWTTSSMKARKQVRSRVMKSEYGPRFVLWLNLTRQCSFHLEISSCWFSAIFSARFPILPLGPPVFTCASCAPTVATAKYGNISNHLSIFWSSRQSYFPLRSIIATSGFDYVCLLAALSMNELWSNSTPCSPVEVNRCFGGMHSFQSLGVEE